MPQLGADMLGYNIRLRSNWMREYLLLDLDIYIYIFILIFYVYLLCGVLDLDVNPAIDLVLFGHGDTTHPLDIT